MEKLSSVNLYFACKINLYSFELKYKSQLHNNYLTFISPATIFKIISIADKERKNYPDITYRYSHRKLTLNLRQRVEFN